MSSIARSLPGKKLFIAVFGVIALYLLFAYLAFPPLSKWAARRYIADKTGHILSVSDVRFDPWNLSLSIGDLSLTEPDGAFLLGFREFLADLDSAGLFQWTLAMDEIRLSEPSVRIERRPGETLNWSAFIGAFGGPGEKPEKTGDEKTPRIRIRSLKVEDGQIEFADRVVKGGFETCIAPLQIQLAHISTLPETNGAGTLSARLPSGARLLLSGDFTLSPLVATGNLAVEDFLLADLGPYIQERAKIFPPEGTITWKFSYHVDADEKGLALSVQDLQARLQGLALRGTEAAKPAITMETLALSSGHLDMGTREIRIGGMDLAGGSMAVTIQEDGGMDLQDWFAEAATGKPSIEPTIPAPQEGGAEAPKNAEAATPSSSQGEGLPHEGSRPNAPWKIRVERFSLDGLAVTVTDRGFASPVTARLDDVSLTFTAEASVGAGEPTGGIEGLKLHVSGIRLLSEALKSPIFFLEGLDLEEGRLRLDTQEMEASRLAFLNGRFEVARDPQGRITQMDILKHQASSSERSGDSGAADSRPWRYRVQSLEAKGFHVTLREESVSPSVCYTVQDLQFTARNVSEDLTASVPVRLEFSVGEGGRFIADGSVIPATPTAEFSLKLDDLSLSSLQPYLGRISRLTLTRGVTSTQGRLTYDGQDALYSGEFAVKDLILTETGEDTPFLTWKSLSGKGMTASGDRLRIKNVTLDAPESAFVIHKDSSTSLQRAFTPEGDQAAPRPPESDKRPEDPSAEGEKAPESPPYLVTIDKVRVSQGKLNFADLSLALPFGARIHRLAGTITGFSSMPGTLSELKLGGQVDEYGLARAAGRIDFLDPTGFTDIAVTFRNVEMTRLTPYSATFAGRKIDSGKLSLDLEYKIKDRQFFGDHKIIMERLSLGERVESPEAVNFPLDLAIAILKDSGGTIHLGLPVSGSLDDPHFSFGGIIWKAFTNIITGIVTSPFRMLGKMLGISGEKLEKVVFDPGNSLLLPPEREKLMELATAMKKRPDLALAITGTFNPTSDLAALRTRQLNRAVLRKLGEKDGYGEDSEPLSLEEPEVKKALERLYADRIGKEALSALQSKYRAANPEPPPTSGFGRASAAVRGLFGEKEVSITPEETSRLKGADLARIMYEDLLSTEDIGEDRLRTLARERATTVRNELIALGLTLDRLTMEAPQKVEGEGREVPVRFTPGSVRASRPDEAATPRPE